VKGKSAVAARTQRFSKERVEGSKTFSRPMSIRLQGDDDIELDRKLAVVTRNFGSAGNFFSAALWYFTEGNMTGEQMRELQNGWVRRWGRTEEVPMNPFDRTWEDFELKERRELVLNQSEEPSIEEIEEGFSGSEQAPGRLGNSTVDLMLRKLQKRENDG